MRSSFGKMRNFLFLFSFHHHFMAYEVYPASRGFSLVFLSVVLPFSSWFWLLAFCFGCEPAEEKTSADSCLRFLLNMREMKMRLPWNFCAAGVCSCIHESNFPREWLALIMLI